MKKIYHKPFNPSVFGRDPRWKKEIAMEQKRLAEAHMPFVEKRTLCPICECSIKEIFCTIFGYDYCTCGKCEHIYSTFVLPQNKLEEFYNSDSDSKSVQSRIYLDENYFFKRVKI